MAPISVPPLRERREDIPDLARTFLQSAGIQNKRAYRMTEKAKELVMNYTWPGNIRELKNAIEYAAMMSADGIIDADTLPPSLIRAVDKEAGATQRFVKERSTMEPLPLTERVRAFERREIERTLEEFGSGTEAKREAAKRLGISLSSLYAKLGARSDRAEQV